MSEFTDWLNGELEKRGWSYNEMARRAGLSSGGVSVVMTERQKPGYEFCIKVAQALKEPPEKLLRLADLLPPHPTRDPYYEALNALWAMTPEWKKQDIVLQLRATVEEHQHKLTEQEIRQQQRGESPYPPREGVPSPPESEDWLDILTRIWSEISREKKLQIYEMLLEVMREEMFTEKQSTLPERSEG